MSILPQKSHEIKSEEKAATRKKLEAFEAHKIAAAKMSTKLFSHKEFFQRASRMEHCGDLMYFSYCAKCGHSHMIAGGYCRDRLCPMCGWRLSQQRFSEMIRCINLLDETFRKEDVHCSMLTLTAKNVPIEKLADLLKKFSTAWYAITHRAVMRPRKKSPAPLIGWARSLEITRNKRTREYHPHIHVLLFWRGKPQISGEFASDLLMLWNREIEQDSSIWHHEEAYIKPEVELEKEKSTEYSESPIEAAKAAALEAAYYAIGSATLEDIPQRDIPAFDAALKGIRMVGYGGCIKEARKLLNMTDDISENDTAPAGECPKCGGNMLDMVLEFSNGRYKKSNKKFIKELRK